MVAGDYPDIPFVPAGGHGGNRAQTQMVVIHATDNTASAAAEANYATHRPDQISAHFYSDVSSVTQGVPLAEVAYGCWPTGNSRSVQFELCGLSNRLSDATLRRIAPIVKRVCDKYGLPIRHVSPADLRAGAKGICGHGDVTLAWGEGDHTDPGPSFPWATFISYVNGANTTTSPEVDDMDINQSAKLDGIFNVYPNVQLDTGGGKMQSFPVPLTGFLNDLAALVNAPKPVQVDAAAVATALAHDTAFVAAIAKAVNDDAARRLAS